METRAEKIDHVIPAESVTFPEEREILEQLDQLKRGHEEELERLRIRFKGERELLEFRLSEMRRRRNTSALVTRLPDEVLSMIFEFGMAGEEHTRFRIVGLPVNVSHVCSRWRTVALASPRLWSRLFVGLKYRSGSHGSPGNFEMEYFTESVRRAKAAPLDVSVELVKRQFMNNPTEERYQAALLMIAPQFSRCKTLTVCAHAATMFDEFKQYCAIDMPLLERLDVLTLPGYGPCGNYPLPSKCDRLRLLQLHSVIAYTPFQDRLDRLLSQLTSFRLIRSTVELQTSNSDERVDQQPVMPSSSPAGSALSLSVLQKTSNLEMAHFEDLQASPPNAVGVVRLTKLHSLRLDLQNPESVTTAHALFERSELPSLRRLVLASNVTRYLLLNLDPLFDLLGVKYSALETLVLRGLAFKPNILLEFLEELSDLRTLDLSGSTVSVHVLDGLKAKPSGTICPNLVEFNVSDVLHKAKDMPSYRRFTFASLKRMLASRDLAVGSGVSRIANLIWRGFSSNSSKITREDIKGLLAYVDAVIIEYPPSTTSRPYGYSSSVIELDSKDWILQ